MKTPKVSHLQKKNTKPAPRCIPVLRYRSCDLSLLAYPWSQYTVCCTTPSTDRRDPSGGYVAGFHMSSSPKYSPWSSGPQNENSPKQKYENIKYPQSRGVPPKWVLFAIVPKTQTRKRNSVKATPPATATGSYLSVEYASTNNHGYKVHYAVEGRNRATPRRGNNRVRTMHMGQQQQTIIIYY